MCHAFSAYSDQPEYFPVPARINFRICHAESSNGLNGNQQEEEDVSLRIVKETKRSSYGKTDRIIEF